MVDLRYVYWPFPPKKDTLYTIQPNKELSIPGTHRIDIYQGNNLQETMGFQPHILRCQGKVAPASSSHTNQARDPSSSGLNAWRWGPHGFRRKNTHWDHHDISCIIITMIYNDSSNNGIYNNNNNNNNNDHDHDDHDHHHHHHHHISVISPDIVDA